MKGASLRNALKRIEKARGEFKKMSVYRALVRYAEYSFVLPGVVLVAGCPAIIFLPESLNIVVALLSLSVGIPCIYAAIKFVEYKKAAEEALKQIQASILIQTVNHSDDQLVQLADAGDDKVTMH